MKISTKIINIELKKPHYIVKIEFTKKGWFSNKTFIEIFHSKDLNFFTHLHTGYSASHWFWDKYGIEYSNEADKFHKWIAGEVYLINSGLSEDSPATEVVDEPIVGKLFRAKNKSSLVDKDGNHHKIDKNDCITVVDVTAVGNDQGHFDPIFCVLVDQKKLYIKSITSDFEQV